MVTTRNNLTKRDWALLTSSACFKFCLVAFYMIALIAMVKEMGFDLKLLSWLYLVGGMEMVKFIISPLIERYQLKKFGHFRSWLWLSALLVLSALIILRFIQPQQQIALLFLACILLNLGSLFFGCATLGFTCSILPFELRGFGGVIQVIAGRVGKMLGGGAVLFIYHAYGWQSAVDFIGVFTTLLILQLIFYREPLTTLSPSNIQFVFLFKRFITFWRQPNIPMSWLILLLVVFIPSGMLVSSFIPRLNALGWSSHHIGLLLSIIEPLCVIVFTPLSGWLLKKYSRFSVTKWVLFSQVFSFSLFVIYENYALSCPYLIAFPILTLSITYALLVPCLLAIIMDKSSARYATLDSSLQFSVTLFGAYLAGFISLRLVQAFGYLTIYSLAFLIALGIWRFFSMQKNV